ncbi:MAG: hypothetical protein U0936_06690 [Planctomycetaceae bacterium]
MQKAAALGGDYYTTNHMALKRLSDSAGAAGPSGTYFVRVREKKRPVGRGVSTSGANQRDEIPAQRFALRPRRLTLTELMYGIARHSPLSGAGETTGQDNNGLGGAEFIGDLLSSDRNTISVSGNLSTGNDVDFFTFSVDYQFIQAIAGVNAGGKSWATIFDIDYAVDGLSRLDTILKWSTTNTVAS